jgi:hypothetical protein
MQKDWLGPPLLWVRSRLGRYFSLRHDLERERQLQTLRFCMLKLSLIFVTGEVQSLNPLPVKSDGWFS